MRGKLLPPILLGVMALSLLFGLILGRPGDPGGLPWNSAPATVQAVMWPEPRALSGFGLVDTQGRPFGPDQFIGQWDFVFFGYMACPDVCPNSLHAMRDMQRLLVQHGSTRDPLRFVFVSVDHEHDTPEAIGDYLDWWQADFLGLSGSADSIARLARQLAVFYQVHVDDSGYRSIDHSSSLVIIDPVGRAVGALQPPLEPVSMVERFETLHEFMHRSGI